MNDWTTSHCRRRSGAKGPPNRAATGPGLERSFGPVTDPTRPYIVVSIAPPPPTAERWNSNLASLDRLLPLVPPTARRALDVGCGEGETTRRLRRHLPDVTGLDCDPTFIATARAHGDDIAYVLGDVRRQPFPHASFDVITAVAVLHHVDHRAALEQLARLIAPGGVLLIVGLARSSTPGDYLHDAFDAVRFRIAKHRHHLWESPAPRRWPPPLTYQATRTASNAIIPGARFKRAPFLRYTVAWQRPPLPHEPAGARPAC